MKKSYTITILIFYAVLAGCYDDNSKSLYPLTSPPGSTTCDTNNVSFAGRALPIFLQNCALSGCHASSSAMGGYTMDTYDGVRSVALSGRMLGAINHQSGYQAMPKNGAEMTPCEIALITSWVSQGAKNN